jgi:hypothetical protein
MLYLLVAFLIAAVSILPTLLARKITLAVVLWIPYTIFLWWLGYAHASGYAGPMFGGALFWVAVLSVVSCGLAIFATDKSGQRFPGIAVIPPVIAWVALIGIVVFSSDAFNASDYRALVGNMEKRVWSQDIQPKDPSHFRAVTSENALYLAKKAIGELGTVGTQFQVSEEAITLQVIRGELWYVIPLDFVGWRAWNNAGTAIGYIMVHAEDPNRQPTVHQLPKEKQFAYTPGAWFGHDLIRHIRLNGNLRMNLSGTHLEIDEDGNPWWITSAMEPTIGPFGDKVRGVIVTDPVTGETRFVKLGEIPAWVDRVMPHSLTKDYLAYWGEYVHGWMNSWWDKKDLTEPENPSLVFSSEHEPMFVTGITSQNLKDDSLIGIVYTNTRTGESVEYDVKGGATDEAVLAAVSKFQEVQFKRLSGADPQLYNLYGTMSSVVPLVNENHAFSGVAIVPINNVQQIAIGRSLAEALRQYQRVLNQPGRLAGLEKEQSFAVAEGVISRIRQDIAQNGSTYYVVLHGGQQAFIGGTEKFPMIPLAQEGDRVRIRYYASGESIVPMHAFDNLTLVLKKSLAEADADVRNAESQRANEVKPVRNDLAEQLKSATPEQLLRAKEALGKE